MRKGKRTPTRRTPVAAITDHAIDLFDEMEALEPQCTCGADILVECPACEKWWRQHRDLHDELKLKLWEFPAFGNYQDTNKTGALERYEMLKAASDARKQT